MTTATATTTATGSWIAVRAGPNWRVWNPTTCQYHRGDNGAVRVYRDADPALRRAAKLNEREAER